MKGFLQRMFGKRAETTARWTLDDGAGWLTLASTVGDRLYLPGIERPERNVLWAFICCMRRATAISQCPLRISDADGNIIEGGDLFNLLASPNTWQDGTEMIGECEAGLTLRNEWFLAPVAVGAGARPDELVGLNPKNLTPILGTHLPTGRRIAMGWLYIDPETGRTQTFTAGELIHITGPDPSAGLRAIDPSLPLRRTYQMDMGTRDQNLGVFLHGGVPSIVLSTEQAITPDQGREFIQRWVDNYAGYRNAHKPAVLHSGMKAEKMGFSPAELQSLDTLKTLTPQEICAALQVKPAMAGLMVGETGLSQGNSTEEQKVAWWSETGNAEHTRIAAALQVGLVNPFDWTGSVARVRKPSRFEEQEFRLQRQRIATRLRLPPRGTGLFVWFDTSAVEELQQYKLKRVEIFGKLLDRGYLPDEVNEYLDLGLPPHPTNRGTIPFSVVEIGNGTEPTNNTKGTTEEERGISRGGAESAEVAGIFARLEKGLERVARESREITRTGAMSRCACGCGGEAGAHGEVPERLKSLRNQIEALRKPMEKAAAKRWSRFFMEQRERVLGRLGTERGWEKALAEAQRTRGGDSTTEGTKATEEKRKRARAAADDLLSQIFPKGAEDMELVARLTPLWTAQLEDSWKQFNREMAQDEKKNPFQIGDPRVSEAIKARQVQGAKANETTAEDLREIIGAGIEAGAGLQEIADSIAGYYRDNAVGETKARPLTAARTQTAGIINDGRMLAARSAGNMKKGWLHGAPEEPREAHLAAQEEYLANPIPLDEPFVVNGIEMMSPGDASAPIEETANCTCMLVFMAA